MIVEALDASRRPWGQTFANLVFGGLVPLHHNSLVRAARRGHAEAVAILAAHANQVQSRSQQQTTPPTNETDPKNSNNQTQNNFDVQSVFDDAAYAASENPRADGVLMLLLHHGLVSSQALTDIPDEAVERAKAIAKDSGPAQLQTPLAQENDVQTVIKVVDNSDEESVDSPGTVGSIGNVITMEDDINELEPAGTNELVHCAMVRISLQPANEQVNWSISFADSSLNEAVSVLINGSSVSVYVCVRENHFFFMYSIHISIFMIIILLFFFSFGLLWNSPSHACAVALQRPLLAA